jgi:hypothetical protein
MGSGRAAWQRQQHAAARWLRFSACVGIAAAIADICALACRGRYKAYLKAGYMQPFHTRRAPYKVKLYHFDGYVIKEYSGAVEKVRLRGLPSWTVPCMPAAGRPPPAVS